MLTISNTLVISVRVAWRACDTEYLGSAEALSRLQVQALDSAIPARHPFFVWSAWGYLTQYNLESVMPPL